MTPLSTMTTTTAPHDVLLDAAGAGHLPLILSLITATPAANPKARDTHGNTALMLAAAHGHADCVNALLKPCGTRWVNTDGMDALMVAAHAGHAPCVAALMTNGMSGWVSSMRSGAFTALTLAAANGHTQVVELLLAFSSPNHQNKNQRTALTLAAKGGHLGCVKLLAPITDRSKQDEFGQTAFLAAISANQVECVRHLMQYEDINRLTHFGWTALMFAIWSGGHACIPVLRPDSDIGTLSSDGKQNALMLAASMGNGEPGVLEYLLPGSGPEDLDVYRCLQSEKIARRRKHFDVADRIHAVAAAMNQKIEIQKVCDAQDRELTDQVQRARRL